jgi:hypothetical protein
MRILGLAFTVVAGLFLAACSNWQIQPGYHGPEVCIGGDGG